MSLRGVRIYGRCTYGGGFSTLVESAQNEICLRIEAGSLMEIEKDAGADLKKTYVKLADGYAVMGILRMFEGDSYLVLITNVLSVGQLHNCDVYKVTNVQFVQLNKEPTNFPDQRIVDLQRLLSAGIFYYAYSPVRNNIFNLCLSAQHRNDGNMAGDQRFFWNRALCFPFERFGIDSTDWCVRCMCGSVLIRTIYIGAKTAKVAIVSRMSCERVGTRFNVRGVNDEGHVANFVETEQLITFEERESSFVQIRGSVPLFWDQPGINIGSHKVKLKSMEMSMQALEKHFLALKSAYGSVTVVNLLGSKEGEKLLSTAFQAALKASTQSHLNSISFDYHSQMKQSREGCLKELMRRLEVIVASCQLYYSAGKTSPATRLLQAGVIRTNCMDCLDRTNAVQTLIGIKVLASQLASLEVERVKSNVGGRFEEVLREIWQKNGDQCSIIYAGTGALEGKSKLKDASRSIARTIQNNLMDSSKQESFDLLLLGRSFGNRVFDKACNLLPFNVVRECPDEAEAFVEREREMCSEEQVRIFVGTWNVNGGKNMYNVAFRHEQSLNAWIFPERIFDVHDSDSDYDIVVIGLEEIVDLNAGNLMKASTTNQRVWRDGVKKAINEYHATGGDKYTVLACEQLVGVCLILFAKISLVRRIRDLAVDEVKTGMGGATGNKGSVAVRMTINCTSVCFVCSHFAAGQNDVAARNEDYTSALKRIRFSMGRGVADHDVVIWLGDFNYRISLGGEEVKAAVRAQNFGELVRQDQLTQQRAMGNVFNEFNEGALDFAPTYKYDTFSDDYDTSEKCRSPAWTDRVLWRDPLQLAKLTRYGRSELKTSDHRPVFAVFQLGTMKSERDKCRQVLADVIHSMGPPDSTILCSLESAMQFPLELAPTVEQKLEELGVLVVMSKIEGRYMHVALHTGVEALAALSMNHVQLSPRGNKLEVRLRSSEWADTYMATIERLFDKSEVDTGPVSNGQPVGAQRWNEVNVDLDEDDEDGDPSSGLRTATSDGLGLGLSMGDLRMGK